MKTNNKHLPLIGKKNIRIIDVFSLFLVKVGL